MNRFAIIIFSMFLLAACGGGGESSGQITPGENSNWDEMKWDQDTWK
jgi:major membrane immunogen (membrane-anchored lipoprotein)